MKTLQVPENISLRWEAWRGFGGPELTKTSMITVIILAVSIVLVKANIISTFLCVAVVISTFAICVSAFSKLENNQSIVDYIAKAVRFKKEQQLFMYKKKSGEEVIPDEEETR